MPTLYYGQIRSGSAAKIRPEDPVGGIHFAIVTVVDHVLDAASGTFGVRLMFLILNCACPPEFDARFSSR